ncbi:hypothetical protein F5Y05DRAFT_399935 [Hypoxylon sp. FL0543]|nr:hypothetical protein F5Y05DRAFT_399935 [Hypoxylon sp. FL0543]
MTNHKKSSKRRVHERGLQEASSVNSGNLPPSTQGPSSLYGEQLASPPASSGFAVPSSPPEIRMPKTNRVVTCTGKEDELEHDVSQQTTDANLQPIGAIVSSLNPETGPPDDTPRSRATPRATPDHDTPGRSKHLSSSEKVKLLRISCSNGIRFLRCSSLGKHAEEEVWTAIMDEFSTTVRRGVFTKYSQVKKANNKICRNRRKRTEGMVAPDRRSQMRDLDTWIDRWVRIWKCRDLVIRIASTHQSIRETIGEKKLKKIFGHRIDGDDLPPDLGVLTFSAPLWKAIQKRIRTVERSFKNRHFSLFPGEDESDWTDENELDDDMTTVEAIGDAPLVQSIEEDFQSGPPPLTPANLTLTSSLEADMEPDLPCPSPRTQARLDRFEQSYVAVLKEKQNRAGKQVSILDLAKGSDHKRSPNPVQGNEYQFPLDGNSVRTPERHPLASGANNMEDNIEDQPASSCVEKLAPVSTPYNEGNVQRNVGPNSSGLQRLKPGTYSAGEPVLLGWHTGQLPLAGDNDTTEQDFRQSVFATITSNGHFNIRLRNHNMQGRLVPPEFRLKGTISVSHRDVTYHPIFYGMSYDEVRLEVARQSLMPAYRRAMTAWVPTPAVQSHGGRKIQLECTPNRSGVVPLINVEVTRIAAGSTRKASETAVEGTKMVAPSQQESQLQEIACEYKNRSRDGTAMTSRVSLEIEKRAPSPREHHGRQYSEALEVVDRRTNRLSEQPNGRNLDRTGTPELLKKFLADEARKRPKPLAPQRIPYISSPPRRPRIQTNKTNRNRITPSRFYGTQSSGRNIGKKGQGPFQQEASATQTRISSHELAAPAQPRRKVHQTHRSPSNGDPALRGQALPKSNLPGSSALLEQDDSDTESFPEVEEIHRRLVRAAEHNNDTSASQRKTQGDQGLRRTSTGVVQEHRGAQGTFSHITDGNSSRTDMLICHIEDAAASLGRTEASFQQPTDGESRRRGEDDGASAPLSLQYTKRSRCQSIDNSQPNFAGSPGANSLTPATVSEPPELGSSTDAGRPPKRQKQSPQFPTIMSTTRSASTLENQIRNTPFSRSMGTPGTSGNHASREQLGTSSDSAEDRCNEEAAQHRVPNSGPPTEKSQPLNRKEGGKEKSMSSRRPSRHGQPAGPRAPETTSWKRSRSGGGKRGRRQENGWVREFHSRCEV